MEHSIKLKKPKQPTAKEREAILLNQIAVSVFSEEEMNKVIMSFRDKYNISICDGLPYYPKPMKVILSGKKLK